MGRTLRPWERVRSPARWVLSHSLDLTSLPFLSLAAWPAPPPPALLVGREDVGTEGQLYVRSRGQPPKINKRDVAKIQRFSRTLGARTMRGTTRRDRDSPGGHEEVGVAADEGGGGEADGADEKEVHHVALAHVGDLAGSGSGLDGAGHSLGRGRGLLVETGRCTRAWQTWSWRSWKPWLTFHLSVVCSYAPQTRSPVVLTARSWAVLDVTRG